MIRSARAAVIRLEYDRRSLQMIIIDDGSADNTGELLDEAVADHPDEE